MSGREQELCDLFADVLGVREIAVQDDFFDLGGHSLLALQLVRRIQSVYGVKVPLRTVYQSPTASALATYLTQA